MEPAANVKRISLNFELISHYMVLSFRGDATKLGNAAVKQTKPNLYPNDNEREAKRRAPSPDYERKSKRRAPSPDYERESRRRDPSPDYERRSRRRTPSPDYERRSRRPRSISRL